jgi:hypothetical protein
MTRSERLQNKIQRLALADKQALLAWLVADIEREEQPPKVKPVSDREVVETAQVGRITYQSELIKCGKANCRCATQGSLHGPYWYGYRKDKGRLKSWYIGKEFKLLDEDGDGSL